MNNAPLKLAAALVLACAGAPVMAQDYVPGAVRKSVTSTDLAAVVGALGHQVLEEGKDNGVLVFAENQNQLRYVLLGTACDIDGVPGCRGVLIQSQFDIPPGTTYETVARASLNYVALNVWVDFEQKSLGFNRYVVLDNGVTMANLKSNVEVLLGLVGEAYAVASGEPVPEEPAAPSS